MTEKQYEWWACPHSSPAGYMCSFPYKHPGPHVAQFSASDGEVRWFNDSQILPDIDITMTKAEFDEYGVKVDISSLKEA